ncbi:hypothetical protein BS50DRAFT_669347 [Corynespora cassiicola Philippines]|uniref:Uncharacterized protein n=1 Tax=Corynespora cassiicola Philippines TaxID=1448308 RepID=A0A2T2NM21_CORCC|nr:hypothetical protein BS50DRAFT_669347 [Corynespora cassiicola Philippines]
MAPRAKSPEGIPVPPISLSAEERTIFEAYKACARNSHINSGHQHLEKWCRYREQLLERGIKVVCLSMTPTEQACHAWEVETRWLERQALKEAQERAPKRQKMEEGEGLPYYLDEFQSPWAPQPPALGPSNWASMPQYGTPTTPTQAQTFEPFDQVSPVQFQYPDPAPDLTLAPFPYAINNKGKAPMRSPQDFLAAVSAPEQGFVEPSNYHSTTALSSYEMPAPQPAQGFVEPSSHVPASALAAAQSVTRASQHPSSLERAVQQNKLAKASQGRPTAVPPLLQRTLKALEKQPAAELAPAQGVVKPSEQQLAAVPAPAKGVVEPSKKQPAAESGASEKREAVVWDEWLDLDLLE